MSSTLPASPAPRRPSTADRAASGRAARRAFRRVVRRVALGTALVASLVGWGWLDRALATGDRVAQVAVGGVPDTPNGWTRARALAFGPPVVALQVGHLHADAHPDELASLRTSTGGHADGIDEVDVNLAVAHALATRLAAAGVDVRLLPATVPPRLRADAFLSLHADASPDPWRRGYKSAHAVPARNPREPWLRASVDAAYLARSALPDDDANVSGAMTDYYAFAHDRLRHAVAPGTAGLIVEMGYLSHPSDRAWLSDPDGPAAALADGVLRYLVAVDRWHPDLAPEDVRPDAPVLAFTVCVESPSSCP